MQITKDMPYIVRVNGIIQYKRDTPPDIQGNASGRLLDAWQAVKAISFGRKRRRGSEIIPATIKVSLESKDEKVARQRWTVAHTAVEALLSAQEATSKPVLLSLTADKIEMVGDFHRARRLEADAHKRELISAIERETSRVADDNDDFPLPCKLNQ